LSFGLNTDDIIQMSNTSIEQTISLLYEKTTDIVIKYAEEAPLKELFVAASMGVEYSVHFYPHMRMMLTDDNGVARWILPKGSEEQIVLKKFVKEERNGFIVFTHLK
jgi:hypothetical protein